MGVNSFEKVRGTHGGIIRPSTRDQRFPDTRRYTTISCERYARIWELRLIDRSDNEFTRTTDDDSVRSRSQTQRVSLSRRHYLLPGAAGPGTRRRLSCLG